LVPVFRKRELQPLQRQALRASHGLAVRIAIAFTLLAVAFAILWFDRDGLRDNTDDHVSFADVIYFTMITVTTVGYGDIAPVTERARLIDAFLITPIRIFLWLIFLGTAAEFLVKRSWEKWRMQRIQRTLHDHIVLAGFGRSGQNALAELIAGGTDLSQVVVIDADEEAIEVAKKAGVATIRGDATRDKVQEAVHIEHAKTVIISCGSDDTSILTVLTSRQLAPGLRIAVAIRNADNEILAQQAGADVVVNPTSFAGLLLAAASHGEHLAEYLRDLITARGHVRLREREATADEVGQSLRDISEGRAVRIHRGAEVLSPWGAGPAPKVEAGDSILEVVPSQPRGRG